MILEALQYEFFQRAVLAAVLASIACGLIGTFVVVKKISSISGGVSHAALGGVGVGHFFGFPPMLGAALVAVLSSLVIGRAHIRDDESLDTLISIVWALGMSLGILLISITPGYAPDLGAYLFGSILLVPESYLLIVSLLDCLIILSFWLFYSKFQAIAFDQEFASIRGVPVRFFFMTLLVLMALTVVVLIKVVGVVLLIALLTIPAVIARGLSHNLRSMMIIASGVSAGCSLLGLFGSYWLSSKYSINIPSGPLIVLIALVFLVFTKSCASR